MNIILSVLLYSKVLFAPHSKAPRVLYSVPSIHVSTWPILISFIFFCDIHNATGNEISARQFIYKISDKLLMMMTISLAAINAHKNAFTAGNIDRCSSIRFNFLLNRLDSIGFDIIQI